MPDQTWVTVADHLLLGAWAPLDARGLQLLYYEALLKEAGIEAVFEPFRPGEGGGFTRDIIQPIRLVVRAEDAERAADIIASAEASEVDGAAE